VHGGARRLRRGRGRGVGVFARESVISLAEDHGRVLVVRIALDGYGCSLRDRKEGARAKGRKADTGKKNKFINS
jgi:hypothetical protein